jgi:proteasome lid subunit RPN8/RPN11
MPFRVLLPGEIYEAMVSQAVGEAPNECCGLLAGRVDQVEESCRVCRVQRRYPLINEAASPTEYLSEPRSTFEAVRDMQLRNLDIVGVYHSHPTSAPVPSRTDLERNYSPEVVNFIISLANPAPLVRAWWLGPDGFEEAGWEIIK